VWWRSHHQELRTPSGARIGGWLILLRPKNGMVVVRFGSLTDIARRSVPKSGHQSDIVPRPLCVKSGTGPSFDHLVSSGEQRIDMIWLATFQIMKRNFWKAIDAHCDDGRPGAD
jgi:hypothetical protein